MSGLWNSGKLVLRKKLTPDILRSVALCDCGILIGIKHSDPCGINTVAFTMSVLCLYQFTFLRRRRKEPLNSPLRYLCDNESYWCM